MSQINYAVTVPNLLSQVSIVGRVTRDGEARFTPSGTKVANLSVAVSRRWRDEKETNTAEQWKEETSFYSFAVWGDGADRAGRILKGDVVAVEFSMADLKADVYTKADGASAASLKVNRCSVSKLAWNKDIVSTSAPEAELTADEAFPVPSVNAPVTF